MAPSSILSIIPIYHPEPQSLSQLISKLRSFDVAILLVANSHIDSSFDWEHSRDVTIVRPRINMGTAYAYNAGIDYALSINSIKYLLILDQDSMPSDTFLEYCLRICSASADVEGQIYCSADKKNIPVKHNYNSSLSLRSSIQANNIREVVDAKASGLLLSRKVLQGFRFDERLYVDYVDWEFCWRIRTSGLKIYEFVNVFLDSHSLGDPYAILFVPQSIHLPSSYRRSIQVKSAIYLLMRIHKFRGAPAIRIMSIMSRVVINPFLDLLQFLGIIRHL